MKETLTGNARAVLDVVRAAGNHPTAQEIYDEVRHTRPNIGLASVYRILHTLTEQGMIREIGRSEESRYDGQVARHDHAVCTKCGTLIDLPTAIALTKEHLEAVAQAAGIELEFHEVRLYGKCTTCRTQHR
ncbi:MAG: transcriptional repressor [Ktedonobacteraceae bacterium]|nr:transcriptional repressor [Ktedonobacteraceae bacterium]